MGIEPHNCECPECTTLKREIERLQTILRSCQRGIEAVDLGNGETLFLHTPHKPKPAPLYDDVGSGP